MTHFLKFSLVPYLKDPINAALNSCGKVPSALKAFVKVGINRTRRGKLGVNMIISVCDAQGERLHEIGASGKVDLTR